MLGGVVSTVLFMLLFLFWRTGDWDWSSKRSARTNIAHSKLLLRPLALVYLSRTPSVSTTAAAAATSSAAPASAGPVRSTHPPGCAAIAAAAAAAATAKDAAGGPVWPTDSPGYAATAPAAAATGTHNGVDRVLQ